jgi:hypothetical protein
VNGLYRLRITDQLFKSYAFRRVVRSQSTPQRLLRRQIKKKTPFTYYAGKGLPELVEEIPLAIRRKMSYHHDGAHSNDGRHFEQLL